MSEGKTKTRNRGEISEFYSFVYIIGNRCVPVVDGDLRPLGNKIEFLRLLRKESNYLDTKIELENEYDLGTDENIVRITVPSSTGKDVEKHTIPRSLIKERADQLRELIVNSTSPIAENNSLLTDLLEILQTTHLSAKSADKSDFSGIVAADETPGQHRLGFSVKSQMGSPSSLINPNGMGSAFKFRVVRDGEPVTDPEEIERLCSLEEEDKKLIKRLFDDGYDFVFDSPRGEALAFNLRLMDSQGPEIIAALLIERFRIKNASTPIVDLMERLCSDEVAGRYPFMDSMGSNPDERRTMLSYKMKNILLGFTTGATVSTKWDGIDKANGGFIVVKKDGQVVCLELFTRNAIGRYLLTKTYFDNPSKARHGHGVLYTDEKSLCLDFQLQVRFKG